MNGAEAFVETLAASGVEVCFANPGTSEMHFVGALDRVEGMRCVLGLFEGVCSGAADGYYRMTDKPASTLLHLGPGLANAAANLHNAKKAGSGVVNIVGEHALYHIKYDTPLTADIEVPESPSASTHWCVAVAMPERWHSRLSAVRSPVCTKTSAGMPGTIQLSPSRASSPSWTDRRAVKKTAPAPRLLAGKAMTRLSPLTLTTAPPRASNACASAPRRFCNWPPSKPRSTFGTASIWQHCAQSSRTLLLQAAQQLQTWTQPCPKARLSCSLRVLMN